MGEVASVKTTSDYPSGIDTSQKAKEKNKNLFILKCDLYWTLKKYSYFPKQATLAWEFWNMTV